MPPLQRTRRRNQNDSLRAVGVKGTISMVYQHPNLMDASDTMSTEDPGATDKTADTPGREGEGGTSSEAASVHKAPVPKISAALVHELSVKMRHRPDAVFDLEHPEAIVPLLPVQELLFAIQEIGRSDSGDLVALATPEQFQAFVDLTAWKRDRVDLDELAEWLEVILSLEDDPFLEKLRTMDPELISVGLRRFCTVIQVEDPEEDPIADTDLEAWWTPDRWFVLVPRAPWSVDGPDPSDRHPSGQDPSGLDPYDENSWESPTQEETEGYRLAVSLMSRYYRVAPHLARALLQDALSGTESEHEEFAYRWRSGRVADLGYETHAEALGVLAYLDPTSVLGSLSMTADSPRYDRDPIDPTDPASLGGVLMEPWLPGSQERFLDACLQGLPTDERDHLAIGYTFLANRVAAATLTPPGDLEEMQETLARARRGLNLGLIYLASGEEARGRDVLGHLHQTTIFRVGHSLTLQLQRLVSTLRNKGRLSLARQGTTLLDAPWREVAEGLSQRFPALSRAFDSPPAPGFRPILTLEDLAHGAALVEDLAAQWPLCFLGLRFPPRLLTEEGLTGCVPHEPGALRLGDIFRTAAVRHLLGESFAPEPLTSEAVERAEALLVSRQEDWRTVEVDLLTRTRRRLESVAMPAPTRLERLVSLWLLPLRSASLKGHVLRLRSPG